MELFCLRDYTIEKEKLKKFLLFFYGVLSVNNILYVFVIGSTPIMLINIISIIILCFVAFYKLPILITTLKRIPFEFYLWFICIFLSIFSVILFNFDLIYVWSVGIVSFILETSIIVVIMLCKKYYKCILNGIAVGIIVNFIRIIYEYIMYKNGIIVNLAEYFPALNMAEMYIMNDFRGVGFFREPGHLMRFICIFSLPVLYNCYKSSKLFFIVEFISIISIVYFTLSSALIFFVLEFVLFFLFLIFKYPRKSFVFIIIVLCFSSILLILSNYSELINGILERLVLSFDNMFIDDSSNLTRKNAISLSLNYVKDYFVLGSGYNTYASILKKDGLFGVDGITDTFSYLLTLLVTIGIGVIPFIILFIRLVFSGVRKKDCYSLTISISLLIYFVLTSTTDFTFNPDSALLLGIAFVNLRYKNAM